MILLTGKRFNRLSLVRWWLGQADEKCDTRYRRLHIRDVAATGMLVAGEVLLWIAMPIIVFVHFFRGRF